jgi:hypothetical protein
MSEKKKKNYKRRNNNVHSSVFTAVVLIRDIYEHTPLYTKIYICSLDRIIFDFLSYGWEHNEEVGIEGRIILKLK